METRAPFVVVGAFVMAAIAAVFVFVYWLHNTSGIGSRATYHIQFNSPVPGLLMGAPVLFNGIRVGEVTGLSLAADNPRRVDATIAVAFGTPVRADTKVDLDFQGLTGVPVIALEGGRELVDSGEVPTLIAEEGAGQSMTQAARDALRRVDSVLAENAEPLQSTISNLKIFSEGLAKNTGRIDGLLTGLERMTGGGAPPTPKIVYDLRAPQTFASSKHAINGQLVIPEPTAMVMFDTQRILFTPAGQEPSEFAGMQWADSIPKMLQAKLIQSFENFDIAHAPLRSVDGLEADYQLLIDIRNFAILVDSDPAAEISFSAKILDKSGRIIASQLFKNSRKLDALTPSAALASFNDAFESVAKDLIAWTVAAL